jgi:hypothetical protein
VSQRLISESSLKTTKESSKTNQKNAAANSNKAFINKYTPVSLFLVLIYVEFFWSDEIGASVDIRFRHAFFGHIACQ